MIAIVFTAGYLIPAVSNPLVSIVLKSGVVTVCYLGLTYYLKLVPEFHKYIPFKKGSE